MIKKLFIITLAGGLNFFSAHAQDKTGDLAIIVGKNCSLNNVTSEELAKIFRAEKSKGPDGVRFILTTRETGSMERGTALAQIYKMEEGEYSKYFLQATFTGLVQSAPRAMNGSGTAKQFVAVTPGAIGYLRASDADDSVKVLKVDGKTPGEAGYGLKLK
jgi:ABC-type phosphate transport system substrate-binding protein